MGIYFKSQGNGGGAQLCNKEKSSNDQVNFLDLTYPSPEVVPTGYYAFELLNDNSKKIDKAIDDAWERFIP